MIKTKLYAVFTSTFLVVSVQAADLVTYNLSPEEIEVNAYGTFSHDFAIELGYKSFPIRAHIVDENGANLTEELRHPLPLDDFEILLQELKSNWEKSNSHMINVTLKRFPDKYDFLDKTTLYYKENQAIGFNDNRFHQDVFYVKISYPREKFDRAIASDTSDDENNQDEKTLKAIIKAEIKKLFSVVNQGIL